MIIPKLDAQNNWVLDHVQPGEYYHGCDDFHQWTDTEPSRRKMHVFVDVPEPAVAGNTGSKNSKSNPTGNTGSKSTSWIPNSGDIYFYYSLDYTGPNSAVWKFNNTDKTRLDKGNCFKNISDITPAVIAQIFKNYMARVLKQPARLTEFIPGINELYYYYDIEKEFVYSAFNTNSAKDLERIFLGNCFKSAGEVNTNPGRKYYYYDIGGKVSVADIWSGSELDLRRLALGNCFKSREEITPEIIENIIDNYLKADLAPAPQIPSEHELYYYYDFKTFSIAATQYIDSYLGNQRRIAVGNYAKTPEEFTSEKIKNILLKLKGRCLK